MRTRLSICARKARYRSEQDALAIACAADIPLRPYRCERCRQIPPHQPDQGQADSPGRAIERHCGDGGTKIASARHRRQERARDDEVAAQTDRRARAVRCLACAGLRSWVPRLPQPGSDPSCDQGDSDTIVICRRSDPGNRYRIPEDLRDTGPIDSGRAARLANERDSRSRDQYGSQDGRPLRLSRQTVANGASRASSRRGRQPDCSAKSRRDDAADWERGTRAQRR